jgi:putative oxygen-independent coproporphyrinogen III oxidase
VKIPTSIGVYVHLPWCVKKCPYCDFNSHPLRGSLPESQYLAALVRDLRHEAQRFHSRTSVASVFFGGGTPSLFSARAVDSILGAINQLLGLHALAEITLEANPGTVESQRFGGYRSAGVNRLSIGIQSFDDPQLHRIGRIHDGAQARRAVETARSAGFDNLNIDLMYGQPEQTVAGAISDLGTARSLVPEHLSWYQMTIEANTEFARTRPRLSSEDEVLTMEAEGRALLEAAGFYRYEVSAYARPGRQSRHNLNYWESGDYLGIGAGAHSKITGSDGLVRRWSKLRSPQRYLQHSGTEAAINMVEVLDSDTLLTDFLLNSLRLIDGFEWPLLEQRSGWNWQSLEARIEAAEKAGLAVADDVGLRASERGFQILNDLLILLTTERRPAIGAPLSCTVERVSNAAQ